MNRACVYGIFIAKCVQHMQNAIQAFYDNINIIEASYKRSQASQVHTGASSKQEIHCKSLYSI